MGQKYCCWPGLNAEIMIQSHHVQQYYRRAEIITFTEIQALASFSAFKVASSLESAFQNTLLKSLHSHTIYNYMMTFNESYMSLEGANDRATWCALA